MKEQYSGDWNYEADVVIVGFGGAGGCAAIEAHDAGVSTLSFAFISTRNP